MIHMDPSRRSREPDTIEDMGRTFDVIMEMMVMTNMTYPNMEIWLKDNEYVNRIVKRVIFLREYKNEPNARPHIALSTVLEAQDVARFVAVVVREDGTFEDPDGVVVEQPVKLREAAP